MQLTLRSRVKVVAYNLFEIIFPPISDRSHFDGGFIVPQGIGYHFSVSCVYILSLFFTHINNLLVCRSITGVFQIKNDHTRVRYQTNRYTFHIDFNAGICVIKLSRINYSGRTVIPVVARVC